MTFEKRRLEIISMAAEHVLKLPFKKRNFWFLEDLRDNFYYAMHLYAAVHEDEIGLSMEKADAKNLAVNVLMEGLRLQDRNIESDLYGHLPLTLDPNPYEAKSHPLPIELLGSLFLYFYKHYQDSFPKDLKEEMDLFFKHIYDSQFLSKEPQLFNHHEAKIFADQLMFGQYFNDQALMEKGYENMKELYEHVKEYGFREYGALPWLWHWIQAVTFARDTSVNEKSTIILTDLLNLLWKERTDFYFKGTWVGAHSRGLSHDVPEDQNNLIDYIQFGDFNKKLYIPRLEGAGFLSYIIPKQIYDSATLYEKSVEIKKKIKMYFQHDQAIYDELHNYLYRTSDYAVGGMWERTEEYMNEQHRWDITIPIQDGINQAYFFQPGDGYIEDDERHESSNSEIILHKNVVVATYNLSKTKYNYIIGCLPKGNWITGNKSLFGFVENTYFAIHLMHPYTIVEKQNRLHVKSEGTENGVVIEVLNKEEASRYKIESLEHFKAVMINQRVFFKVNENSNLIINYESISNDTFQLESSLVSQIINKRTINGKEVNFQDYVV